MTTAPPIRTTSRLLIDEHPLMVLPSLAAAIGLHEAIVLQQIHYWVGQSGQAHDGRRWIYNSYPQWQAQFPFLTVNQIRRAIEHLEARALLLVGNYNTKPFDRTKWYSVDYGAVDALFPDSAGAALSSGNFAAPSGMGARRSGTHAAPVGTHARPIPETTSETTTESAPPAPLVLVVPDSPGPMADDRIPVPPDLAPDWEWAAAKVPSLNAEEVRLATEGFIAHMQADPGPPAHLTRAQWGAKLRKWLTDQVGYNRGRAAPARASPAALPLAPASDQIELARRRAAREAR